MARPNGQSKREWDLSGKKLKVLPQDMVGQVAGAKKLDLQRNRLKQFSWVSTLVQLKELNLSRNDLQDFPMEIGSLQGLERLYMNQNSIRTIPEGVFSCLGNLQFLKLSTNHLSQIPPDLVKCQKLTYLNLSHNVLVDLQPLVGLSELKELHVERNALTELPPQLFKDSKLNQFKSTGNPLKTPPEEVCVGGVRDIQNYFDLLEMNPDTNTTACTVKTMFLGSSMAGKSTLCRSLRQEGPVRVEEEDRTEGIEICEKEVEGVRFLFWDFAGQEEYYLTHHVFITPRALVILAVDLASYSIQDSQSYKDKVWFWINNIQLRVPDSVVIPVGTHCDQCLNEEEVKEKAADIDSKVKAMLEDREIVLRLQKKKLEEEGDSKQFSDQINELDQLLDYKLQVMELITIDCTKQEGINKLKDHIMGHIRDPTFPCTERTLPRSYGEVESAIQNLLHDSLIPKHGIIPFTELRDLILDVVQLSSESLHSILRYLHRIGIIVWYEEIPALMDQVFIQPSFLILLFKTIVRPDLVKQLEGLSREPLRQEGALMLHRSIWVGDLRDKGTLSNVATRVLVRRELDRLGLVEKDLVTEVVGTRTEEGTLLSLLQYFEVCLPAKVGSPLDPAAPEFIPGQKQWESTKLSQRDPDGACLFPTYLKDNKAVVKTWGEDKRDDINVHMYFLPEIPHGFFHRLIIKTCSFYPRHWAGIDHCLLCSGTKLVLLRERSRDGDQFIEIRSKRPESNGSEIRQTWDMILTVMSKLSLLLRQWPGLTPKVFSPCKEKGCAYLFPWRDWQDLKDSTDIYKLVHEERLVCQNGHTQRTEMLFPKVPDISMT